MNIRLDLSDCTLSTEHQAIVDALNELLAWLPDDEDPEAALRLVLLVLEAADIAPQATLARVVGLNQSRSVRLYKQRLRTEGLSGLFAHPIPGRPAITTKTEVEKALLQVILAAVIKEHVLPDDTLLAERVNQILHEIQEPEAGQVTSSMVETIRLRWGIRRPSLRQQLQEALPSVSPGPE